MELELAYLNQEMKKVNKEIKRLLVSDNLLMQQVISWILKGKGKQLRPKFTLVSARYGTDCQHAVKLAALIEIIHMASLVHDDIVDNAETRRGSLSVQKKFGKSMAVYAGDYMIFQALGVQDDGFLDQLFPHVYKALRKLINGELSQNANLYNVNITPEQYLENISGKTASLFSLACEVGARSSEVPKEQLDAISRFGLCFGMLFQIKDDLLDYTADDRLIGKPVLQDFENGVFTLPIIYCLQNSELSPKILKLSKTARKRGLKPQEKSELLEYILAENALENCRKEAETHYQSALTSLNSLPDIPETTFFRQILEELYTSI
ncbi:MAG: polyprenyl synthetase family protein [Lachnospiraceae bacterium]|nr:polyprenyl synthetase family protein [Lachnospiraceae bacterium]